MAEPKEFISPRELLRESFALAGKVYDSGYRPDLLLAVWRGGTPIGIAVHEFLLYKGLNTAHAVVKVESYRGIGVRGEPEVDRVETILDKVAPHTKVLIVDDIFDSGNTLAKLHGLLAEKGDEVRTATLYYKPSRNVTGLVPDFFVRETEAWVVFPHELAGLSMEEIREKDDYIHDLLAGT